MMRNWRRDIRCAKQLPSAHRPKTPPLLKSINKRARNFKQKRFYQNSQFDWINYYNKLIDEYHKIEQEINGLDLNIDADNNLHSTIKQHRQEYTKWMQSITHILSNYYPNESNHNVTHEALQEIKNMFNHNNDQLNGQQQILEKELKALEKSINTLGLDTNDWSIRKENLKFYEFCLENNISSTDTYGGWTQKNQQKFVTVYDQYKKVSFNRFYEQIKLFFPQIIRNEMHLHYEWYRLYLQHIATNKRIKIEARAKKKLLLKQEKCNQLIEKGLNRLACKEHAEKKVFDSKLKTLHVRINEIKQVRNDESSQYKLLQEKENEEKKFEEMEQEIKWNEYRNLQKSKLNEYYQDKISKLEIIDSAKNQQREIEKVKTRELNRMNKKRVEYRDIKRNEKILIQKELMLKNEEEIATKELRLSHLRMNVEKQLNHNNIDDKCGVLKPTQNTLNKSNNMDEMAVNMFPNHGYSDKQLFKDPKFVLMSHLLSNNLHKNKYAKECMKNTEGIVKPRKDCNHFDIF